VKISVKNIVSLGFAVILVFFGITLAFDPPRIIGIIQGPNGAEGFGCDYSCAGDQDGDGYADLLFSNDPFNPSDGRPNRNVIELYHGSADGLNDTAIVLFQTDVDFEGFGQVQLVGQMTENLLPLIAYQSYTYPGENELFPTSTKIVLTEGGTNFDGMPVYIINRAYSPGIFIPLGYRTRPADLDGDGYDDLIAVDQAEAGWANLMYFSGHPTFDTIPEWRVTVPCNRYFVPAIEASSGCDINADGYDDVLFKMHSIVNVDEYYLFLGGAPMDTTPLFHFRNDHYEGLNLKSFAMLPDVNGDGYDDWGIFWFNGLQQVSGYYIFFGGRNPDMEPDLTLHGNDADLGYLGEIASGDFNGDGISDIVTSGWGAYHQGGEINIFLGSRWGIHKSPDISVDCRQVYGDEYASLGWKLGAVGDYNGDGIDDFVTQRRAFNPPITVVLAGSRNWRLAAPEESSPLPQDYSLTVSPNPFNNTATIIFNMPQPGNATLHVYDIQGRRISTLMDSNLPVGELKTFWNPSNTGSGIYLLTAEFKTREHHDKLVRKLLYLQ
jgi:hypothetical protein